MNWLKTHMRRVTFVLLITGLLAMSLLFAACSTSGNSGSSASNDGNTNITTTATQSATRSSGSGSTTTGNANQQVQNAIQAIDGAQNDVNNADATATSENGSDPLP
jgi:hypothetical protein